MLAAEARQRFARAGTVRAARSVAVVEQAVPTRLALAGTALSIGSRVTLIDRLVVVRFADDAGRIRTLVWEPRIADSIASAPFFVRRGVRSGLPGGVGRAARAPRQLWSIPAALERCGVTVDEVDCVALGDLRGHDLRRLAGTVRPVADEHQPRSAIFPSAQILVQSRELTIAAEPHPLEAPWYVPGGTDDLIGERIEALDGDRSLGDGVWLISTPGLTAGHQSLVLNTPDGLWVVSSNGVASDCWQPLMSKIPGVRRSAESEQREAVMPAAGVHDPLALYDSLLTERGIADASRTDPRWLTILPDRELSDRRRQWPVVPTFSHGGLRVEPYGASS